MASTNQFRANQANARLSTGPRTPEGKKRSRLNGVRHGLTGQFALMPHEDRAAFETFCAGLLKDLAPEGALEQTLAESIAQDHWRLNRSSAIETNIFALGFASGTEALDNCDPEAVAAIVQARTFLNEAPKLALLTLYAQRIQRGIEKSTTQLRQLQSERRANAQQALEEALALAELNESQGLPLDEIAIGFGFSAFELSRMVDRRRRLRAARELTNPRKLKARAA